MGGGGWDIVGAQEMSMKRSPVLHSVNLLLLKPKRRGIQTPLTYPLNPVGSGLWGGGFFFFLAALHGDLWDLSSLTKDRTYAPGSGGVESQLLDHQGNPGVGEGFLSKEKL